MAYGWTVVHLPTIIELNYLIRIKCEPLWRGGQCRRCVRAMPTHSKPKWPVVAISHSLPSVPSKFDFDGHDSWQRNVDDLILKAAMHAFNEALLW